VDIDAYLERRIATLESTTEAVKDFRVFDFSYVPETPLLREEAKGIIDALLKYGKTGIPQNVVMFGSRGCGKTLLLRYLQRLMKDRLQLEILYANCRNENTSFKILARLLGASVRGTSLQELYVRFLKRCPGRTVVVLDEVDLISKKDPNKDILYFLSRSDPSYMVVCLSNNPRFLSELDSSTRSSLQADILYLKNYDAQQIGDILRSRAQAGLHTWAESDIGRISALTVQRTNSDVRVAIKTLFYVTTGESANVQDAFAQAQRDIYIDLISDLNDRNLLILRAVQKNRERFVRRVYDTYQELSKNCNELAFSYSYFLNNLSYLQSLGLVMLIQTKVNRAYTSTVSILFNEQVLETVFKIRFG